MKRFIVAITFLALSLTATKASEINMGFYKFKKKNALQHITLADGTELLTLIPQIHIPHEKSYKWGNFSYPQNAKATWQGKILEYSNTGFYQNRSSQNNIALNVNLQVDYSLKFTPEGLITAHYKFSNKGDTVLLEPYCNIKLSPNLLRYQQATMYKINDTIERIGFGENINATSINYRGGKPKDLHIEKMVINTILGQPFVLKVKPESHIRMTSKGAIMVYDNAHFATHFWKQPLNWKEFKKGDSFAISFALQIPTGKSKTHKIPVPPQKKKVLKHAVSPKTLPVITESNETINPLEFEATNHSQRAVIKNGTFYRNGKPVYFIGPWLSSHFFDYEAKFPVSEFKDMPSHNQIFNAEIAKQMGFNTCHPQHIGLTTLKKAKVFERYPHHIKTRTNYIDRVIKGYKNMPLVMDYAHIGWLFDNHWRKWFKKELFQANTQWHGFVPFCLAHPNAWKVQKTFWQDGVRLYLKNGANPWIYELFNEPAYDSRDKLTQNLFIARLKKKYKSLAKLNSCWNSKFKSFEQITASSVMERQKGLQVEWFKFIEDHWVDILKKGKQAILEIDKRPNIYFSQQRGTSGSFLTNRHGFDEYKIARAMDVVNTEGGITFNYGKAVKSDNPMDEYINTHMNMHLDMCRAAAEEKPVIDTEQSTRRYSATGRRIPSLRSDLRLMLWNEAIHGSSMSLLYNWGKRSWQWKPYNLKGAEEFVNKPGHGWAAGCLLNPYCYPKKTLGAIKEFDTQIKELAEIVLPRPRIKGTVALLLSNPSRRYTGSIESEFTLLYQAATMTNIPKDIIFEEQLPKGFAEKYHAIISPICRYSYTSTLPALQAYVKNGGILILNGMDLEANEYGTPISGDRFIGLKKRTELKMPIPVKMKLSFASEKGYTATNLSAKVTIIPELGDAKAIASSQTHNIPLITVKKLGKGKIYYIACELGKSSWATIISSLLNNAGVAKPFIVRDNESGKLLPSLETQVINRGTKRLYYFANWSNISAMAKLSINNIEPGNWTVSLPFRKMRLQSPGGHETWSSLELQKGIPVFCPGWDAQLLLLEKDHKPLYKQLTIDKLKTEYQQRQQQDINYARSITAKMKHHAAREKELNSYTDIDLKNCMPIDISKHCNMAFKDEINGDKKGGTSDQGDNDLRSFPLGKQILAGVPFHVLDPAMNNGKSMITLRSKERPYFPETITGIPVNQPFKAIYFLHTKLWGSAKAEYIIHYIDGTKQIIPINNGENIRGWWKPRRPKQGKIAWKGKNSQANIGVYCWKWNNPYPNKSIKSLDIKTKGMLLGTIAITGEK